MSIEPLKILVLGDSGVGKTSLVHLLCRREPLLRPEWTVGCNTDVLIFAREGKAPVAFEFWDVGGSARYETSRSVYYREAHGLILVFDLSNKVTLENVSLWQRAFEGTDAAAATVLDIDRTEPPARPHGPVPTLIVGTKADRRSQLQDKAQVQLNCLVPMQENGHAQRAFDNFFNQVLRNQRLL
eukprot:m.46669 g.46669  ORF g.46669 m.46669 type:complete len:184 (+) comp11162_c0_seq1:18-569(+)